MAKHFTAILADDEKNIREGLSRMKVWQELGIEITGTASNGEEALELIRTLQPDFAVMDIKMPIMTGLDALAAAKADKLDTDIIILSGYSNFDLAKDAIRHQAKAYLLKPVDEGELKSTLISLAAARTEKQKDKELDIKLTRAMLNDLVTGRLVDTTTVAKLLSKEDPGVSDTDCYVMVISLQKRKPDSEQPTAQIKERLAGMRYVLWYMDPDTIVIILNTSEVGAFTLSTTIITALNDCGYTDSIITSGNIVNGLQQIAYSFTRALSAQTYRFYYENARIFSADMISDIPPSIRPGDIDTERLEEAIIQADVQAMNEEADKILELLTRKPYPPKSYVCSMLYSIVKTVESNFEPLLESTMEGKTAENLAGSKTLGELRTGFRSIFHEISKYIESVYGVERANRLLSNNGKDEEDEVIREAKDYIQQHIHEQILIEDIADEVHLSPSYFAIYFRKVTGEKLRNYILSKKMEYAKKELMKKNASVNDVADSLGYNDYRSFSRAFKNITGMTPTEFIGKNK